MLPPPYAESSELTRDPTNISVAANYNARIGFFKSVDSTNMSSLQTDDVKSPGPT